MKTQKKWPALCRRTGAPLAPRTSQPQHPPNEQKIKKYLGADQGSFWLKKGSSTFFNLFLFHVVAPLGLRNWEPEPGPESALFQLAGAKRTKNGFRRGAAVRPFDFVFGSLNLHGILGGLRTKFFFAQKRQFFVFNLFLFHFVAPLGFRNWEPESGPESGLFHLAGAKRTQNGFRRGAAVRPFDFVFGGANLHRIWGGCVARLTPNPEQKIYFLLGSARFGRFSLRFWAVFFVLVGGEGELLSNPCAA